MSSLYFLTDKDFYIGEGHKGNLLNTVIKGISLVFFSATMCEICQNFIPMFKQLPKRVVGCQFAIVNLTTYPKIIRMSSQTIMPLTEVPYIVLYVNGKPILRYDDVYDIDVIAEFITSTMRKLQGQQDDTQFEEETDETQGIPAYSIGKPKSGGGKERRGVCYLGMDGAYRKRELPPEMEGAQSSIDYEKPNQPKPKHHK